MAGAGGIEAGGQAIGTDAGPDGRVGPPGPPAVEGPPPPPVDPQGRHPGDSDRPRPLDERGPSGIETHGRQLTIATPTGPVTLTASAPRNVIERPVLSALTPLLVTLLLLGIVLTVAATIQIRLGLRPVRRLRDEVARVRTGEGERAGRATARRTAPAGHGIERADPR